MPKTETVEGERSFEVVGIARVEGEGTLRVHLTDGKVSEARLSIWEAPRYFERILIGRTPNEVVDITAVEEDEDLEPVGETIDESESEAAPAAEAAVTQTTDAATDAAPDAPGKDE